MNAPNHTRARERGTATIEFVLAALFILGPLTAMIIDFGQVLNVHNIITRAAEEGALAAGNSKAPDPVVATVLVSAGLDPALRTTAVTAGSITGLQGSLVSVTVSYNLSGLQFFPWPNFMPSLTTASATATVRHL
ncbi:TadE/TadG family type IV pilus assembly protein [Fundidesulfovibrio agrisoli]|uniref:TadE/TadG family type IV pilus assembly protein n=1 Tax=Fundidesulfovibrio agrisoli TaxID=2922717 RepID=UPI001FAC6CA0|nr:TadE/TadG family type IV pilus assembly protein [Fundidesulfovibrio agrisoli]